MSETPLDNLLKKIGDETKKVLRKFAEAGFPIDDELKKYLVKIITAE